MPAKTEEVDLIHFLLGQHYEDSSSCVQRKHASSHCFWVKMLQLRICSSRLLGLFCLLPPLPDPRHGPPVCLTRKLQPQTSTHVLVSLFSSSSLPQTINASASLPISLLSLETQAVSCNTGCVPSRGFFQVFSASHPSLISFPRPSVCRLTYPPNHSQPARSRSIPPSIRKLSHPLKSRHLLSLLSSHTIFQTRDFPTPVCARVLSRVRLFAAPWAVPRQAPGPMGFPRQE